MDIYAIQAIAIIEQNRLSLSQVNQDSGKPAVQFFKCIKTELFVEIDEAYLCVRRACDGFTRNKAAYLTRIVPREFGRTSRIGADESDEKSEFTIHVVAGGIKTFAQHWPGHLRERRQISLRVDGTEDASYSRQVSRLNWSRREDLNTPSADYKSAALALSYTGEKS